VKRPRRGAKKAIKKAVKKLLGVSEPTVRRPLELYGRYVDDEPSKAVQLAIDAEQCPFLGSRCVKYPKVRRQPGQLIPTLGSCVVTFPKVGPLIFCPKRFLENRQIFLDCTGLIRGPGRYYVVPEVAIPAGNVDYFLVRRDRDETILDYLGIEVQSLDTTGSVWQAREDVLHRGLIAPVYQVGVNWKMSAKTILVQLAHKAPIFEALGKKLVLVAQTEFINYIRREFDAAQLRNADASDPVIFHTYDCVNLGGALSIVKRDAFSTSGAGVQRMVTRIEGPEYTDEMIKEKIREQWHKAFELAAVPAPPRA
jgi:hypothetical protein